MSFKKPKLHSFSYHKTYFIMHLNTAITSGTDEESGKLVLGNFDLYHDLKEIKKINLNAPIIVLGHHGTSNFTEDEKRVIEKLFEEYNVSAYLCGDAHTPWYKAIGINTVEITMGCMKYEKGSQTVFSVGEIASNGLIKNITAYSWDPVFSIWDEYSHFNSSIYKHLDKIYFNNKEQRDASILKSENDSNSQMVKETQLTQQSSYSELLLRLFFVNRWTENNEMDESIVARLLRAASYNEKVEEIRNFAKSENSPLIYSKSRFNREYGFTIKDPLAIWEIISPKILKSDLNIFKEVFIDVFRSDKYKYSKSIRKGLTTSLAIYANNKNSITSIKPRDKESIVIECLHGICPWNEDMKWGDLDDVINLLAEAYPEFFLSRLEKSIDESSEDLCNLFDDYGFSALGNTMHLIINTLTMLAFEPQYLDKCVVILGKLSSNYSDTKKKDEFISAIAQIYLPWYPLTMANLDEQIDSLRLLYKATPELCCKVLLQLLPNQITTSVGSRCPSWRMTIPEVWKDRKILMADYIEAENKVCELLIEYGSINTDIVIEIANKISDFTSDTFNSAIDFLKGMKNTLGEEEKLRLWHILDEQIAKHTYFSTADWAMNKDKIEQLNLLKDIYNPNDLIEESIRIFGWDAYTGVYEEGEHSEEKLNKNRSEKLMQIFTNEDQLRIVKGFMKKTKIFFNSF